MARTQQNGLLLDDLRTALEGRAEVWGNEKVPPNDRGVSLGQAAIACTEVEK